QKEQELDKQVEQLDKAADKVMADKQRSLETIRQRLVNQHPQTQIVQLKKELSQLIKRQTFAMRQLNERKSTAFTNVVDKLALLNPLETMKRGYAIPYAENGEIIRTVTGVNVHDSISVTLADGSLHCQVADVKGEKQNGHE